MNTSDTIELKSELLSSIVRFNQVFYQLRTGREFKINYPAGRESHIIQIARALKKVLLGEIKRLIINIPPRYGKTEMIINFIAFALARYPDSNFIYVSYAHSLAKKQTQTIRDIILLPHYRNLFGVRLAGDSTAKDDFELETGGSVYAVGAGGSITGRGAGVRGKKEFGGALIIDDIHKPDEALSDTIRDGTIEWFYNTAQSRLNNGNDTPIIYIGQRVHENDLAAVLMNKGGWETLIIPALDKNNNALDESLHTTKDLLLMQEQSPYNFAAQYLQNPQPAGGGIFRPEWFYLMDENPEILFSFITADTAETDKTYNDATVFSFWGLYKIKQSNVETDIYGLHWLDCREIWIEPKDLESEFMSFYAEAMRFHVKPSFAAIEKKSTGTTLVSILSKMQGLQIMEIERTKASGSKTSRFLDCQSTVARKRVSLLKNAKHTNMCVEHCRKITANNTHARDDIADTLADAIKIGLIDEIIIKRNINAVSREAVTVLKALKNDFNERANIMRTRTW